MIRICWWLCPRGMHFPKRNVFSQPREDLNVVKTLKRILRSRSGSLNYFYARKRKLQKENSVTPVLWSSLSERPGLGIIFMIRVA